MMVLLVDAHRLVHSHKTPTAVTNMRSTLGSVWAAIIACLKYKLTARKVDSGTQRSSKVKIP